MKTKIKFTVCPLAVIMIALFFFAGCSDDDADPVSKPTLTTLAVTDVTETSAKSGGNISEDGGGEITARGVVWSTGVNPTLENHIGLTTDGTGTGMYVSNLAGLSPATTYFVRAYAINPAGTSYGNDVMFETSLSLHVLTLGVEPQEAGSVTGAGEYPEGEQVNVAATAEEGWEFVNWTGDTDHVDDPNEAVITVVMPAQSIALTAVFQEEEVVYPIYGDGVTDIDGNQYVTVIIGDQEWMAENLRTLRYREGSFIPTGLSNTEWENTSSGAYAVFDHNHEGAEGINSPGEMVAAYGILYNWYAANDARGLCPSGWRVPTDDDWTQLLEYVVGHGFLNEWDNQNGAGNALKSCRQVGSPLGGDCNTTEHPRWRAHDTFYGFDEFGFSAVPGGSRWSYGTFSFVGVNGYWWSTAESLTANAWSRGLLYYGSLGRTSYAKASGLSVRCIRQANN